MRRTYVVVFQRTAINVKVFITHVPLNLLFDDVFVEVPSWFPQLSSLKPGAHLSVLLYAGGDGCDKNMSPLFLLRSMDMSLLCPVRTWFA